jgi:hypothetical protein
MMKKIEGARKELTKIANFISSKGLKIKVAMFNENQIEYFRGRYTLVTKLLF